MSLVNILPIVYNQTLKDDEILKQEFVLRQKQFNSIYNDIKTSKMEYAEQHYLILGQRGSGKTTLLHRLRIAINENDKLNKWLIPIVLNEEQYNITELFNLWEEIALYLEQYSTNFSGLSDELAKLYETKEYANRAFDILVKAIQKEKKKVVLFIDNLNDLFKKFSTQEQRRLREILITCNDIRLIGASSRLWEALYLYNQPFMDFFKTVDLDALSNEDIQLQLRTLAKIHDKEAIIEKIIKENPERINVLRILTGGVPRNIALLFQIFVDNEMNDSVKDLQAIVEKVTPLYKHRMDDLSTQHQKIVDAVAKFWDACSTAEIAQKTRLESKAVSAQLRMLEKDQFIEKIPTNTKNHLYRIRERFFNIWYLMRMGRANDREKVIWLTKFLDSWCDKDDLKKRLQYVVENTKNNKIDKATSDMLINALMQSKVLEVEDKWMVNEDAEEYYTINHEFNDDELLSVFIEKIINRKSIIKITEYLYKNNKNDILYAIITNGIDSQNINKDDFEYIIDYIITKTSEVNNIPDRYIFNYIFYIMIYFINHSNLDSINSFIFKFKSTILLRYKDYQIVTNFFILNDVIFQLLIAKHQYHTVYNLFQDKELKLKDRMKPIYYALMHFMKDEYPNEYLKMGSELKEPVEEIIEKILKMRELYA